MASRQGDASNFSAVLNKYESFRRTDEYTPIEQEWAEATQALYDVVGLQRSQEGTLTTSEQKPTRELLYKFAQGVQTLIAREREGGYLGDREYQKLVSVLAGASNSEGADRLEQSLNLAARQIIDSEISGAWDSAYKEMFARGPLRAVPAIVVLNLLGGIPREVGRLESELRPSSRAFIHEVIHGNGAQSKIGAEPQTQGEKLGELEPTVKGIPEEAVLATSAEVFTNGRNLHKRTHQKFLQEMQRGRAELRPIQINNLKIADGTKLVLGMFITQGQPNLAAETGSKILDEDSGSLSPKDHTLLKTLTAMAGTESWLLNSGVLTFDNERFAVNGIQSSYAEMALRMVINLLGQDLIEGENQENILQMFEFYLCARRLDFQQLTSTILDMEEGETILRKLANARNRADMQLLRSLTKLYPKARLVIPQDINEYDIPWFKNEPAEH